MGWRLPILAGIENLIEKESIAGKVLVNNMDAWRMVSDVYEMMIIDLASFFAGLVNGTKGVCQLNQYLPLLQVRSQPPPLEDFAGLATRSGERDSDLWDLACADYSHKIACFKYLFPDRAIGHKANRVDVENLQSRLRALVQAVKQARDKFHAHRYEEWQQQYPHLIEVQDAPRWFEIAQDLLNKLRFVVLETNYGYPDPDLTSEDETAQDLFDIMLHGSTLQFYEKIGARSASGDDAYYWRLRNDFYASAEWNGERRSWTFAGEGQGTPPQTHEKDGI